MSGSTPTAWSSSSGSTRPIKVAVTLGLTDDAFLRFSVGPLAAGDPVGGGLSANHES
jgi:hypothetical protein